MSYCCCYCYYYSEEPVPHEEDPDFPKGCISGCETRLLKPQ